MDRYRRLPHTLGLGRLVICLSCAVGIFSQPAVSLAQIGGGGGNAGGGGNQIGGILIDAAGVVRSVETRKLSAKLQRAGHEAFIDEHLGDELLTHTDCRYVSLVRLEEECARLLQAGEPLDEPVKHLAGLQRIDYLFVDPDRSDLVIAGPAEGFAPDADGRMLGLTTGRPPLRLDDLLVALQAAESPSMRIGCSIDPEPQQLAQLQEFVQHNSNETSPAGAARRYQQMAKILGPQRISVFGVPAESHFAVTLVEADFRMKRISLGVEPSGVRGLKSHLSLLRPNGNSIQRWWFTPFYDGLYANADRTAFQFDGQRVQLLAQEEIADDFGERSDAAFTRASAEEFAKMFTRAFPELADRSPVFAELQNLFDLAILAALLQQERLPGRVGAAWSLFLQHNPEVVPSFAVPRQVPSMSTFLPSGRGLILGLVGGVSIEPRQVLQQIDTQGEEALRLDGQRRAAADSQPTDTQSWWWD